MKPRPSLGALGDMKEYNRTNGKLFQASQGIIAAQQSRPLPEALRGRTLYGRTVSVRQDITARSSVSLVALCHNSLAEDHAMSFIQPFMAANPAAPCYELLVFEKSVLYAPLFPVIWTCLFLRTPSEKIPYRLAHIGPIKDDLCLQLGISNRAFGYIWLVDRHARIRWAATGKATDQELETMHRITRSLEEQ